LAFLTWLVQVVGAAEVLPLPEPGTPEAAIRARLGTLQKVRTTEYTIVIEIDREQASPPRPEARTVTADRLRSLAVVRETSPRRS